MEILKLNKSPNGNDPEYRQACLKYIRKNMMKDADGMFSADKVCKIINDFNKIWMKNNDNKTK